MDCDNIGIKCEVRDQMLEPLYTQRRQNRTLGKLGATTFQDPERFLRQHQGNRPPKAVFCHRTCVAFGDMHGDFLVLLSVLKMANLIDNTANWTGRDTLVVFCGDILDREGRFAQDPGTSGNTREEVDIVQFLHGLDDQARDAGGRVVVVVGNHEISRVFWKETPRYEKYAGKQKRGWGPHRMEKLFTPGGLMARYMACRYPLVVRCRNFVFMHGGPSPKLPRCSMRYLNHNLFAMFTQPGASMNPAVMALAWERFFSKNAAGTPEEKKCTKVIQPVLRSLGVKQPAYGGLVIGHTVQDLGLDRYCNGAVWRLDLGMSEAFGRKVAGEDPIGGLKIVQDHHRVLATTFQSFPGSDEVVYTKYLNGQPIAKTGKAVTSIG